MANIEHSTDKPADGSADPSIALAAEIRELLKGVIDPELGSNIVDLGMVKAINIGDGGIVTINISLTTSGCPLRAQIQKDARARVESLKQVEKVKFVWGELTAEEKKATMATARKNASENAKDTAIPLSARVLAIASGKGGVGKSSITANLAMALAKRGLNVGVIDADIWGFSIPRMLGIDQRLEAEQTADGNSIKPCSIKVDSGRIDVVSMGLLVEDEDSALLWRGLMLNRAVQHFLEDVAWNEDLHYVLIDMPPGTGDVALGLARMLPRAEMIVVTTPNKGAQKVAARAVSMARKSFLRVAGVIENMTAFEAPDGTMHALFGAGGGAELAAEAGVALIGQVPIEPAVSAGGDDGTPAVLGKGPASEALTAIATAIVEEVAPPIEMSTCTSRMFEAANEALDKAGLG